MALYLDEQTRPYLEAKFKTVPDSDFIGKRIQGMLKADSERLDEIDACFHLPADYVGKKTCCSKCGSFFDEGMGQTWTIKGLEE